jgi:hypothetical protein
MSEHSQEHHTFADENNRRVKIQIAVSRVLEASAVKHQGTREEAVNAVIAKISQNHTIRVADRGWVVAEDRNGVPVDLPKLVQDTLLLDKNIGDPGSIAVAVREGSVIVGAKDELTTTQQKVEFIRKFGEAAWAKLPAHRSSAPTPSKEMTQNEYMTMSVKDRIAFQKTISERELGQILHRR